MEKPIQIALNILNNQEILGKEYISISEIKEILYDVDKMFNVNIETDIKKDFATKEQREVFNDIMSKVTGTKTDKSYPDSVFYMVDDDVYIEHCTKNNNFYVNYQYLWVVFELKFNLKCKEIGNLLNGLLGEYFNCNVNTIRHHRNQCKYWLHNK